MKTLQTKNIIAKKLPLSTSWRGIMDYVDLNHSGLLWGKIYPEYDIRDNKTATMLLRVKSPFDDLPSHFSALLAVGEFREATPCEEMLMWREIGGQEVLSVKDLPTAVFFLDVTFDSVEKAASFAEHGGLFPIAYDTIGRQKDIYISSKRNFVSVNYKNYQIAREALASFKHQEKVSFHSSIFARLEEVHADLIDAAHNLDSSRYSEEVTHLQMLAKGYE